VGRFGTGAGKREATLGGAGAALVMCALEATQRIGRGMMEFLMIAAVMVALAAVAARVGSALGQRMARR